MRDKIYGWVQEVLDGDTFVLDVDSFSRHNDYEYNDVERIRLKGFDAPERGAPGGQAAKARLVSKVQGQRVCVEVAARDRYRRIIGDVVVNP